MTLGEFQTWLNAHGAHLIVDGQLGPATRNAIVNVFTNKNAPAITPADLVILAERLGCTTKQLRAVAKVESGGGAYDMSGRPKILFERHYFHRLTEGRWSTCAFSNASAGGYGEDSWGKLIAASAKDAWAAFQSASWGKFQIMGAHWKALSYASPLEMAHSMVENEAAHYDALVRFVKANKLTDELSAISTDPATCRAFARAYNGSGYEKYRYHEKIAEAMK